MEKEKERLLPRTVQEEQRGDGSKLKLKPKPMTRKGVIAALSYMACSGEHQRSSLLPMLTSSQSSSAALSQSVTKVSL